MHAAALDASSALLAADEVVHIVPQNIAEFWNVCTRPPNQNGLGFSSAQTDAEASRLETLFPLVLDEPGIYKEWRQLVVGYGVKGVRVHDARLVAAMRVHGISHLLTFDDGDFKRYREITVMTPKDAIRSYSSTN
jgi:predicted nucleic acid-binding protein